MTNSRTAIISDFSKTLTSGTNPTTWSVFAKSGLLGSDYTRERNAFFDQYHDYELAWNVDKTKEWWSKHLGLFVKYGLTRGLIDQIVQDPVYFEARTGLQAFFDRIRTENIDLFIVSSGVDNFIESFLTQNNISLDGIRIHGNRLFFDENGVAIWYDADSIITPLNKYEHHFTLSNYEQIILLGDDTTDLQMYKGTCLKIGFCDESVDWYDTYLGKDGDLGDVMK